MKQVLVFTVCLTLASFMYADAATITIPFREGANDNFCDCVASFDFRPVCGTDGRTYPNYDSLKCANECDRTNVDVQHDGYC